MDRNIFSRLYVPSTGPEAVFNAWRTCACPDLAGLCCFQNMMLLFATIPPFPFLQMIFTCSHGFQSASSLLSLVLVISFHACCHCISIPYVRPPRIFIIYTADFHMTSFPIHFPHLPPSSCFPHPVHAVSILFLQSCCTLCSSCMMVVFWDHVCSSSSAACSICCGVYFNVMPCSAHYPGNFNSFHVLPMLFFHHVDMSLVPGMPWSCICAVLMMVPA